MPAFRSNVRLSTLDDQIFVHSSFPTDEAGSLEQMTWFLLQEVSGEAGFEPAQIKVSTQAKLEMARDFWNQMDWGSEKACTAPCSRALLIILIFPTPNTWCPVLRWETR